MLRKNLRLSIFTVAIMLCTSFTMALELKVALYPYVPRIDQFKRVISENWEAVHPDVEIVWVDEGWDGGYNDNPKDDYDLFVFDATYFTYFKNQGWLMALDKSQIDNFDDFFPFVIGGMYKDNSYWAIPQLACTEYLIYQKEDKALSEASKVSEIVEILGKSTYKSLVPPPKTGMMMDFSDNTSDANYYIKTVAEITDKFPVKLPYDKNSIKMKAIKKLSNTLTTVSQKNAKHVEESSYQRGEWYGENHGRAYVGFSESLSQIPSDELANIRMKVMPWSDNVEDEKNPLFYSDVIGISPKTSERNTTELAIQLANLMASTSVIVNSFKSTETEEPQYLTPVRYSVMEQLANNYPAYATIQRAIKNSGDPILFDLGENSREWLAEMRDQIKNDIFENAKYSSATTKSN